MVYRDSDVSLDSEDKELALPEPVAQPVQVVLPKPAALLKPAKLPDLLLLTCCCPSQSLLPLLMRMSD